MDVLGWDLREIYLHKIAMYTPKQVFLYCDGTLEYTCTEMLENFLLFGCTFLYLFSLIRIILLHFAKILSRTNQS